MKLKHDDTICGYTAKKIRNFLGGTEGAFRFRDHIKPEDLPYFMQLHFGADAENLTDELFKRGWLVRAKVDKAIFEDASIIFGELGEPIISLSQIGKQSRIVSLTKRFGRGLGEKIVTDIIARAEAINSCDDFLHVVWELALFGSILDPEAQTLGDVDVACDIRRKAEGCFPEADIARADLMGFGHLSYDDKMDFGETEVKRILKNRNRRLSMQDKWHFDRLEPKPKSKTIYTAPAGVRARARE